MVTITANFHHHKLDLCIGYHQRKFLWTPFLNGKSKQVRNTLHVYQKLKGHFFTLISFDGNIFPFFYLFIVNSEVVVRGTITLHNNLRNYLASKCQVLFIYHTFVFFFFAADGGRTRGSHVQ